MQVLQKALESFNIELVRAALPEGRALLAKATEQSAFIANQGEHWLTQRSFCNGKQWWNLNSLLSRCASKLRP